MNFQNCHKVANQSGIPSGVIWSLSDMQELLSKFFVSVSVELRTLQNALNNVENKQEALTDDNRIKHFIPHVERLLYNLNSLNAVAAIASAKRLEATLKSLNPITIADLGTVLYDIESRFADHLDSVKLFVL